MIDNYRWQYGLGGAAFNNKIKWTTSETTEDNVDKIAIVTLRHCLDLDSEYPINFRKSNKKRGSQLYTHNTPSDPLYLDYEVRSDGTQIIWWWTSSGTLTENCGIDGWDYDSFFNREIFNEHYKFSSIVDYCELTNWYMGEGEDGTVVIGDPDSSTNMSVNIVGADFSDASEIEFDNLQDITLGENQWGNGSTIIFEGSNSEYLDFSNMQEQININLKDNTYIGEVNLDNANSDIRIFNNEGSHDIHIDKINQRNWHINANPSGQYSDKSPMYVGDFDTYDVSNWTFDNAVAMSNVIPSYGSDIGLITGMETWNVSNVKDFSNAFSDIGKNEYDISNWDLSSARDVRDMFYTDYDANDSIVLNCSGWKIPSNLMNASKTYLHEDSYKDVSFCSSCLSFDTNVVKIDVTDWDVRGNIDGLLAYSFFQDIKGIGGWSTSRVNSMKSLFEGVKFEGTNFVSDSLRSWNTNHVTNMNHMFYNANFLDDGVNISPIEYISTTRNGHLICGWDVSNVTDMGYMFARNDSIRDISDSQLEALSSWDVSNVTDFSHMFERAITGTDNIIDLTALDSWGSRISINANFTNMFGSLSAGTIIYPNWDGMWIEGEGTFVPRGVAATLPASSVALLAAELPSGTSYPFTPLTLNSNNGHLEHYMFPNVIYSDSASSVNNTTNLTTTYLNYTESEFKSRATEIPTSAGVSLWIYHGYYYCPATLKFADNSNFTAIKTAVSNCAPNGISFRGWDTSSVTDMHEAFDGWNSLGWLDLTGWSTGNVTNMARMFRDTYRLNDIFGLTSWNTSHVTDTHAMFHNMGSYVYPAGSYATTYHTSLWTNDHMISRISISGWNMSSVLDMNYMFANSIVPIPISWSTSRVVNMNGIFKGAITLKSAYGSTIYGVSIPTFNWGTGSVTNMTEMFADNGYSFNMSGLDTISVTNMTGMFSNNSGLIDGINSWDVSNVTNMSNMFRHASLSQNVNLSNWITSNVTNFSGMFSDTGNEYDRSNIPRGVEHFDISSVRTDGLVSMFANAKYNGSSNYVFDFSGWAQYISRVTTLEGIFQGLDNSSQLITGTITGFNNWDVSNVTNTSKMFKNTCMATSINLSSWDMSSVTNTSNMFEGTLEADKITLPTTFDYRTIGTTITTTNMFNHCGVTTLEYDNFVINNKSKFTAFVVMLPFYELIMTNVDCQITDISNLFSGAGNLRKINLTGWDTSSVTNFDQIFYRANAEGGVLDFSSMDGWDISSGTSFVETCRSNLESNYSIALALSNGQYRYYEQGYTFPNWTLGDRDWNDNGLTTTTATDMTGNTFTAYTFTPNALNNAAPVGFGSFAVPSQPLLYSWDFTDNNMSITQESSMGNYSSPSYYAWSTDGSNTPLRIDDANAPTITSGGAYVDLDFGDNTNSGQYTYNPSDILSNYFYTSGYRIELDLGVVDPTAISTHEPNYNTLLESGVGFRNIDGGISFDAPTSPPEWYFARDTVDEVELPDLQNQTIAIEISDGAQANTHNAKVYVVGTASPVIDYTYSDDASALAMLDVWWRGGYYTTQMLKAIRFYDMTSQ